MTPLATTQHHAEVTWHGDRDDLRAHTVKLADQEIAGSGTPELGGDASKADPEELFVAALSACHMLWFLALARGERLRVTAYDDEAEGTMDDTHFTQVVLRPRVGWEEDPGPDVLEDLHHRAHEACFIANSVSCPVEVQAR